MSAASRKPRFWRLCRIYFRRFRIAVWLVALALLGCLIYVNQIGLPGFVKRPLLDGLRERGLDLQFSRLRLRWYQGIVAEHVRLGPASQAFSPEMTFTEVQLQLDSKALKHFKFQPDGLVLHQGRVVIPIPETNQPPRRFIIENVESHLRLLPGDVWSLDDLKASFMGATFQFSALITNASVLRDWDVFRPTGVGTPGLWELRLHRMADVLERTTFSAPPSFHLDLRGDASDFTSFRLLLLVNAPGAEMPWGTLTQGHLKARLFPGTNDVLSHAELTLEAADAQTRWANVTNLVLTVRAASVPNQTNPVLASMSLSAAGVESRWASATGLVATATWVHALTNAVPLSGHGEARLLQAKTQWGEAASFHLAADLLTPADSASPKDPSWGAWTHLQPYFLDWHADLTGIESPHLRAEALASGGTWRAPLLVVTNLHADLYQGRLDLRAQLNVATRRLEGGLNSDLDPHALEPILSDDARNLLRQITWNRAPQLEAAAALTLPPWTNPVPDWRQEVLPTLQLTGQFDLAQGVAYRGISALAARSHFAYSNSVWWFPDIVITRPEGHVLAFHQSNERSREFLWRIRSGIDPGIARPLLDTNTASVLDLFTFTQPPSVGVELRGQWQNPASLEASGTIALTNFTFRGEPITSVQAALHYTNQFLQVTEPRLERGTQHISADGLALDLIGNKIYLTNGFSTADPFFVSHAIGPKIGEIIDPYAFSLPPTAHVHGTIPLRDEKEADLHFDVDGGPFRCLKFTASRIHGRIHWVGQNLSVEVVRAECYGGRAGGQAVFDFTAAQGANYQFSLGVTNIRLEALAADLHDRTNNPEGLLNGELRITRANTEDIHSLFGSGNVSLRDGLIWDIPLFGVFSSVLNGVSPGLGNSRASAATARFIITNGVVRSDDFEIRSSAYRMAYRGTVDLDGDVNIRVDVAPLRDLWLLGPAVSTVFWPVTKLFEYKVTGTLSQPKTQPANVIPKLMQMPFHPFRTFRDLFPEESPTNPIFAPLPE